MAELQAGFYNAVMVDGVPDRIYNADEVNDFLEGLISNNGIFATVSTACQVLNNNGMRVIVKAGKGMVDNHWFRIESDIVLDIETADVILNRIDSIVVRNDNNERKITLEVKQGVLATNPVAPSLTRSDGIYEICLANITINKNVTSITPSMITDTRPNNEVCGWISGLINQIDTTTLYNQYEDAQNFFINEKEDEFNSWFDGIKDDVKATTLYREYSSAYASTFVGQQDISIPTTINYQNNGLDVLNVFINGDRLIKDIEYTINSDGTSISLTRPLDVIGTPIEFVNKKSVDGTAAEEVVVRVEVLEEEVNNLKIYGYECNGVNDNVLLSNVVKNFLDGTGSYVGVEENAQLKIIVNGTIGISELIDNQSIFDFVSSTNSLRRVMIDFGNATIPGYGFSEQTAILAGINMDANVIVENANIYLYDGELTSLATVYGVHGGQVKNCRINIVGKKGTFYGVWGAEEVSNSEIDISNLAYKEVICIYETKKVLFNNIKADSNNGSYVRMNAGICMGNIGTNGGSSLIEAPFALGENVADFGNIVEE